MKSKKKFAN